MSLNKNSSRTISLLLIGPALYIVLFLLFSFELHPQSYITEAYTTGEGMSSATVFHMTQDQKGVMWFATAKGVSSYDGTDWNNFNRIDGLPFSKYYRIQADKNNNIWALTRRLDDGITIYQRAQRNWYRIKAPANLQAQQIKILSILLMHHDADKPPVLGVGTEEHGFYTYSNEQWQNYKPGGTTVSVYGVSYWKESFCLASNTGLYLLSGNAGARGSVKKLPLPTPSPAIYSVSLQQKSFLPEPVYRLWLCGEKWVGYVQENTFHLVFQGRFPGSFNSEDYRTSFILPDRFGGLWFGSPHTFFNISAQGRIKKLRLQNALFSHGAFAMLYDREYNLWTCNFRGAFRIPDFCFENYQQKDGLLADEVTAITQMNDGTMVFGHNGGFSFLNNHTVTTVAIPAEKIAIGRRGRVEDMCVDKRGNIWASIEFSGIAKITPSLKITWYNTTDSGKKITMSQSIINDDNGDIIAASSKQLFKYQPGKDSFDIIYTLKNNLSTLRKIFSLKGTTLYAATSDSGVLAFKPDESGQTGYQVEQILAGSEGGNQVYSVCKVPKGITSPGTENPDILVGSSDGVYIVKDNRLARYPLAGHLVDDPVYFITPGENHRLWFGLSNGVLTWDGKTLRQYTRRNGLVGRETNRSASYYDSRGQMWIGMEMGASCYIKERETPPRPAPILELLYMDASGATFPIGSNISLKYYQNDLIFHFRTISFHKGNTTTYSLKLEGFDHKWNRGFPASNQSRYTNIPPGDYQFHLRARNSSGRNSAVSSGIISIHIPYYRTWWFLLLLVFSFILIIFFLGNFISNRRLAARLEVQVRNRTKELRESEEELRTIFQQAHDAIIIFDPATEVVREINQRACQVYGFTREEFIGLSLKSISKDTSWGEKMVTEIFESNNYRTFETVQFRKNGAGLQLEVNASIINYRGGKAILSINRDISERTEAYFKIRESLKQKDILLKEIHHRVKNNLQIICSLLELQTDSIRDPETLHVFQGSRNRINSMALIHEALYRSGDLTEIDVAEYTHDVVDYFFGAFGDKVKGVSTTFNIQSVFLGMDKAIPVGLILTELVSNALEHAFPDGKEGLLTISINSHLSETYTLSIIDDGIGLPGDIDVYNSETVGFQLVITLIRQLGGSLELDRKNGTNFKITFPYTIDAPGVRADVPPTRDLEE